MIKLESFSSKLICFWMNKYILVYFPIYQIFFQIYYKKEDESEKVDDKL